MKTKSNGITRVLQSASTLRRQQGLGGSPTVYAQAYAYLKSATLDALSAYSAQRLPLGSGITEAACKIVFTQRLKRSDVVDDRGGQVIVDLRVLWLSGVWESVHQRYLASQSLPFSQIDGTKGTQHEQQAASDLGM